MKRDESENQMGIPLAQYFYHLRQWPLSADGNTAQWSPILWSSVWPTRLAAETFGTSLPAVQYVSKLVSTPILFDCVLEWKCQDILVMVSVESGKVGDIYSLGYSIQHNQVHASRLIQPSSTQIQARPNIQN